MSMNIKELKEKGTDVETKKSHSKIQPKVLAILKSEVKASGEAMTQKEVAEKLSKIENRTITPQQARSALMALRKKGTVVRRIMEEPDETGNTHFWYPKN